jgi:hypothetical protein
MKTEKPKRKSKRVTRVDWLDAVTVTLGGDGYAGQGCLRKADFEIVKNFCERRWVRYGERV